MKRFVMVLSIAAIAFAAGSVQADVVLYEDTFTEGTGSIVGRVPEIRLNAVGASGTATWQGEGSLGETWSVNVDGKAERFSGYNNDAYLPFAPQSGRVYTMSVDLLPTAAGQWMAMGYTQVGDPYQNVATEAPAWIMAQTAGATVGFEGPGEASYELGPTVTYPKRFSLVLDTTNPSDYAFTWLVSDTDGSNSVEIRSATSYGSAPSIAYVEMGGSHGLIGTMDNFRLTVDAIPEPSMLVLLGSGLVGLLCYAWRKRR